MAPVGNGELQLMTSFGAPGNQALSTGVSENVRCRVLLSPPYQGSALALEQSKQDGGQTSGAEREALLSSLLQLWAGQRVRVVFFRKTKDAFLFSPITLLIWIF